jgi:hypothetical protein
VAIDGLEYFLDKFPVTNDLEFSVGATSSEYIITDIAWSPTGISRDRGCILAAVTSRHEVLVFEPRGNPVSNRWQMVR